MVSGRIKSKKNHFEVFDYRLKLTKLPAGRGTIGVSISVRRNEEEEEPH